MIMLALLIVFLFVGPVQAIEFFVATTGSNSNSCAQAQNAGTPKLTIAAGVSCLTSGDTLTVAAGTYTNQGILDPPAGTASVYTIIRGNPTGARPVLAPNADVTQRGFYCTRGETCKYIEMRYFDVTGAFNSVKADGSPTIGYPHHLRFVGNKFHDTKSTNMFFTSSDGTGGLGGDHYIAENEFYRTGVLGPPFYGPGYNTIYNTGNRTIIERNTFHNLHNGVGIWHSGKRLFDVIVRYNVCYDIGLTLTTDPWQEGSSATGYGCVHVSVGGGRHQIYGNVIYNSGEDTNFKGISVNPLDGSSGSVTLETVNIHHNTIYNMKHSGAMGIRVSSNVNAPGTVLVSNNLIIPVLGVAINDQSGLSAITQTTNRITGTPSALWTNPATGNLTLNAGSAAINSGTNIGNAFCGTNPDQGAVESLVVVGASIATHFLDVTICSTAPPVQPNGTWTVGCTGTGCGTPVVANKSVVGGGIVRLDISGISGGNCAASQTWTVSASGANTDSALIGNTLNQSLFTVTNFSVDSSACDGSGPPPDPGAPLALYEFDGNANDSSGNGNHATTSNITYTTGKYGQGALTADGVDSHVDTILSGHNPSSTHLVVAVGVWIDPANLGQTKDIWGVPTGTNQRFLLYRSSANVWRMSIQNTSGTSTEFPVVSGWTHLCVKANATTDTATLYVNGVAGTVNGASVITYTSYVFAGNLRFGLPSGFGATLSGAHILDRAVIYNSDASCADIYAVWEPPTAGQTIEQAAHYWQGVYLTGAGAAEDRGTLSGGVKVVNGGASALVMHIKCEGGDCGAIQPRFRYSLNGGSFLEVPDAVTSDGVRFWGEDSSASINAGIAEGPLVGALSHTDGVTLLKAANVPSLVMNNNTSYTLRGIFRFDTPSIGDTVCFKIYDQGGSALNVYTPTEGACITTIGSQANGGF